MSTAAKRHECLECGKVWSYIVLVVKMSVESNNTCMEEGRHFVVEQAMKWVGGGNGAPFWKLQIELPNVTGINLVYRGGSRNLEMGGAAIMKSCN